MGVNGKVLLTDVAEHAGVSVATVSRVINGKAGVSADTRRRVLGALDVLGYQRSERDPGRNKGLVGLIVPDLTNPIFPAFVQAMELELSNLGYTPLLCTQSPGGVTEGEYLDLLVENQVDGIIIISGLNADSTASHVRYQQVRAQGVPLAFVNGYVEGVDATFVSHDDGESMDLAVRHLVSLGHTHIGLATGPRRFMPSMRKIEGFKEAIAKHLPQVEEAVRIEQALFTVEGGQAATAELLRQGCTAIVCASDLMAIGAVRAVRSAGGNVPGDTSVVGFDDAQFSALIDPALTTIRQSTAQMSHAVVFTLINEINGETTSREEVLFQPELIVRESTGANPRKER